MFNTKKMVTHNRSLTLLLDTIYKKWLYIIGVLHLTLLPDIVTCLIQKMVTHNRESYTTPSHNIQKWLYIIGVLHVTLLLDTVKC